MHERTGRERRERDIEFELYLLRFHLDIARHGGYEHMERRYQRDIEEAERELERVRQR